MSSIKKITKNALANGTGLVCEAVISFCMLPYILHRIGDSAYGVWAFTIAISGYMGILNIGFRPAINKYVAQYNATGEWQKVRDLIQASLFSYSFCALIIIAACTILSLNISLFFNIPKEFEKMASLLVFMVGLQMASGLVAVVFGGVISGLQRYEINNAIEISVMLARTAIIFFYLDRFPSLETLAIAHFSMTFAGYIATIIITLKITQLSPLRLFRVPNKESLITIFKFSAITFVISTVGRIIMYIDSPLIAGILTTSAVTYYTIGSRLIKYLRNLVEVLVSVLAPATSDLYAGNEHAKINSIFLYSSKIASLIIFPSLFFFIFMGKSFLVLWIGGDIEESFKVMLVIAVTSFLYLPHLPTRPILYGIAKHKIIMYLSICSGLLSILTAVMAAKSFGLLGIAIGLSAPQALIFGILGPIYTCRLINVSWGEWFKAAYLKPLVVTVPFIVIYYLAKKILPFDTWSSLVLISGFNGAIFLLTSWCFMFSADEKTKINSILPQFLNYKS